MRTSIGLEVELFTGTRDGRIVGRSAEIAQRLPSFVCEPDARNTEYVTPPLNDLHALECALLAPRRALRALLAEHDLTIVPGSTLPSKGDTYAFIRSDPDNPYHTRIAETYGTRVVTTSIHYNFGIADPEALMRAYRLMRLEAPMALALTASSPFLNGEATGLHSTRWATFPRTPPVVPLFPSHDAYIAFVEDALANARMWNVRHLWSAARPNGPARPHEIDRLEVRICDLTLDVVLTCGVGVLLMHRVGKALDGLDPLREAAAPHTLNEVSDQNESAAARASLDAEIVDWRSGDVRHARDIISDWLDDARATPLTCDERGALNAVERVLERGNDAMRWAAAHRRGRSIASIMAEAVEETEAEENARARTADDLDGFAETAPPPPSGTSLR